jgi:hypothetical protein
MRAQVPMVGLVKTPRADSRRSDGAAESLGPMSLCMSSRSTISSRVASGLAIPAGRQSPLADGLRALAADFRA